MTDLVTRPSERARWARCSGYPVFRALLDSEGLLPPEQPSEFAARGTVGHALVEEALVLLKDDDAWEDPTAAVRLLQSYVGKTRVVDGLDVEITQELADAAVECVLHCCDLVCEANTPYVFIEHRGATGTLDFGLWDADVDGTLTIVDQKFGAGVTVSPRDNPQLQVYAVELYDEVIKFGSTFSVEKVRLVINQPFKGGYKESWHDVSELLVWDERIAAERAACAAPERRLAAGSWCRWCACATACPALEKAVESAMAQADVPVGVTAVSPVQMGERLRQYEDVLVPYGAALRARLHEGLEDGTYASADAGWKVVAKRAVRRWVDEGRVAVLLSERGFSQHDIYKRTLLSPAQIEKLAKSSGLALADLSSQVESVSSGTTLARVTDARPGKPRLVALGAFPA